LLKRHPVHRWHELHRGFCKELGNLDLDAKGEIQAGSICKDDSTDAKYRDRLARSSDETFVMKGERRGQLIQRSELNN
jgi:hypothetical protein